MTNYNIILDLLKIRGARFVINNEARRCVVLPIDNMTGTVTERVDAESGKRCVHLNLTAFELREKTRGQSHLIKPAFTRAIFDLVPDEVLRQVPFIGNLKPWTKDGDPSGNDL